MNTEQEQTLMTCSLVEIKLDMAMTSYSKMETPHQWGGGGLRPLPTAVRTIYLYELLLSVCEDEQFRTNSNVGRLSTSCKPVLI
jgi:hypothetical protein